MMSPPARSIRAGTAYILAVFLLALFVAIGAALAALTNVGARAGKNAADIQRARMAAESGLGFAIRHLRALVLPHDTNPDNVIVRLAEALAERLEGTENLDGAAVTCTASTVSVPSIRTQDGRFRMRIVQSDDGTLVLEVRGQYGGVQRLVAMDLYLRDGHPNSVFNYGLASRGPVSISGNARICGRNDLAEASVVSAANEDGAISIGGSAVVDGDIFSTGPDASVVISGTPTIAGSQDPVVFAEHLHFGVQPPVFPEVDTGIFRSLATHVVDDDTDTAQSGAVFENILIKAGTNPTFASDVVINGVVYIEAPNVVTFSGKVTLNGLVATEASEYDLQTCRVSFEGQVEAFGAEALPDLPQFQAVKQLGGTFICAPGFEVGFAGRFTTISGTVAAERLTFSGQAEGSIEGSVIGLGDYATSVSGQVEIIIDRTGQGGADGPPPGFLLPKSMEVDARSYREEGAA